MIQHGYDKSSDSGDLFYLIVMDLLLIKDMSKKFTDAVTDKIGK